MPWQVASSPTVLPVEAHPDSSSEHRRAKHLLPPVPGEPLSPLLAS